MVAPTWLQSRWKVAVEPVKWMLGRHLHAVAEGHPDCARLQRQVGSRSLEDEPGARETDAAGVPVARVALKVLRASDAERQAHEAVLDDIVKANKGLCLWRPPEPVAAS